MTTPGNSSRLIWPVLAGIGAGTLVWALLGTAAFVWGSTNPESSGGSVRQFAPLIAAAAATAIAHRLAGAPALLAVVVVMAVMDLAVLGHTAALREQCLALQQLGCVRFDGEPAWSLQVGVGIGLGVVVAFVPLPLPSLPRSVVTLLEVVGVASMSVAPLWVRPLWPVANGNGGTVEHLMRIAFAVIAGAAVAWIERGGRARPLWMVAGIAPAVLMALWWSADGAQLLCLISGRCGTLDLVGLAPPLIAALALGIASITVGAQRRAERR